MGYDRKHGIRGNKVVSKNRTEESSNSDFDEEEAKDIVGDSSNFRTSRKPTKDRSIF